MGRAPERLQQDRWQRFSCPQSATHTRGAGCPSPGACTSPGEESPGSLCAKCKLWPKTVSRGQTWADAFALGPEAAGMNHRGQAASEQTCVLSSPRGSPETSGVFSWRPPCLRPRSSPLTRTPALRWQPVPIQGVPPRLGCSCRAHVRIRSLRRSGQRGVLGGAAPGLASANSSFRVRWAARARCPQPFSRVRPLLACGPSPGPGRRATAGRELTRNTCLFRSKAC